MPERNHCLTCDSGDLEVILDLGSTPLADVYVDPTQERWYPLRLAVCVNCWQVQLLDVVPDAELYNDAYQFRSSTSPSLVAYHQQYAAWLAEQVKPAFTVEIACNDGSLLQHLPGRKLGVEPSSAAWDAFDRGLDILHDAFDLTTAKSIRAEHGPADLVIANHVLPHVSDPADFARSVAHLLADDGIAVIEVQDFTALLLGNGFDHVYHQHRGYFTTATLMQLLARNGLGLVSCTRTEAQGGSIRMAVRRGKPVLGARLALPALDRVDAYRGLQARAEILRARLLDLLAEERRTGRTVFGYAAAAKATTLLHWCGLTTPGDLTCVIDTTPGKIGHPMPGTTIPITAPGEHPDTYLLLAHNYLPGVLRRERQFIDGGGRLIVPVPAPVIV